MPPKKKAETKTELEKVEASKRSNELLRLDYEKREAKKAADAAFYHANKHKLTRNPYDFASYDADLRGMLDEIKTSVSYPRYLIEIGNEQAMRDLGRKPEIPEQTMDAIRKKKAAEKRAARPPGDVEALAQQHKQRRPTPKQQHIERAQMDAIHEKVMTEEDEFLESLEESRVDYEGLRISREADEVPITAIQPTVTKIRPPPIDEAQDRADYAQYLREQGLLEDAPKRAPAKRRPPPIDEAQDRADYGQYLREQGLLEDVPKRAPAKRRPPPIDEAQDRADYGQYLREQGLLEDVPKPKPKRKPKPKPKPVKKQPPPLDTVEDMMYYAKYTDEGKPKRLHKKVTSNV
jgi:hypothetical protein